MKTREEARKLLDEWISSDSLKNHCLSVAFAMEGYAIKNGLSAQEIDDWWICGLLHDLDWEKFPTIEQHTKESEKVLREQNYPEEIIESILAHNPHNGVSRNSLMAKTLFAVDELSGLIMALSKVRPNKFEGMNAESVEKAMKKKDFASAINREDIEIGIKDLGVERKEHFNLVIDSLRKNLA